MIQPVRSQHVSVPARADLRPSRFFPLLLAAGLLLGPRPQAFAASRVWTNTNFATATWNRASNWFGLALPGSADTAQINNGSTARVITGVTGNYATLVFGSNSTGSGNLDISGGTLNGGSATRLGDAAGGHGNATVSAGTWNSGSLFVGFFGTGTLNLSGGALNSSTGGSIGLDAVSVGTATVSGGTWTNAGDLVVGGGGTGTLNLTGNGVVNVSSGGIIVADSAGAAGTLNFGTGATAGTANVTTNVSGGSGNATVNFNHSGNYTFAPALTGNMSVNVIGNGTTTFAGNNSYSGSTVVTNGMLLVLGDDSAVTGTMDVHGGATLGGNGTIGSDVTIGANGTLSPGLSPGLLTFSHGLTMGPSSTLEMQLTGTGAGQFDQIYVGGNFTAGGTLDLNVSYAASAGDSFLLFTNGGYGSGNFTITTNLAGGLTWDTANLATTGIVSVVPEPSVAATASLGLAALAGLIRHRRRARRQSHSGQSRSL